MSKKPVPKKKRAKSQSGPKEKSFINRSRKKLEGMVDFMLKLKKNPRYIQIQQESENKDTDKITKVKA